MGTLIDKLNYLNETKELLEEKLDNIGQGPESNVPLRQYLNWTDDMIDKTKDSTAWSEAHWYGEGIQDGVPTQNNPVSIITNTGPFEVIKNKAPSIIDKILFYSYSYGDRKYEITELKADEDFGWYWIDFNNDPYVLTLPEGTSNLNINFYYSFKYPNTDWTETPGKGPFYVETERVPFEIYLAFTDREEQKVFTSPNFDEMDSDEDGSTYEYGYGYKANFTISRENSPFALVFRNANTGEILKSLGLGHIHFDEVIDSINIENLELIKIKRNDDYDEAEDIFSITTDNFSVNFFNKDNLNYNFSNFTKYHDSSWDDEDSFIYEINNEDTNNWQLTSLDNGIRIQCTETDNTKDLGIFYILPNPRYDKRNNYKDYDLLLTTKFNIVGDRQPCLWTGFLNLTHDKFCLTPNYYIPEETIEIGENLNSLSARFWTGFPEGSQEEKDEKFIIIGFGNLAGENATENDYIDYFNIRLVGGMWDEFPSETSINTYVPYLEYFPLHAELQKQANKRIFNGTENNWSCTETDTPGIYKFDLIEDENDPWNGKYYYYEYEEEIYDPETGEPTGEYETIIEEERSYVLCNHFQDMHKKDEEDSNNGYCSFYGTGISFYTNQQTTLEEWKIWLQNNPITLYYVLENPSIIQYFEGDKIFDDILIKINNESKNIINNYLNNWDETISNEQNWQDKLSKYKQIHNWTDEVLWPKKEMKRQLELLGAAQTNSYPNDFKDYFDWVDDYYFLSKRKNKKTPIESNIETKQYLIPTQTNPSQILSMTGDCCINFSTNEIINGRDFTGFDEWGTNISSECLDANTDTYWISFNNSSEIKISDLYTQWGLAKIYLTYSFNSIDIAPNAEESYSTEIVPFAIYWIDRDGSETLLYNSNGAAKASICLQIPKDNNINKWIDDAEETRLKIIRTDNQEPLTNLGIQNLILDSWYQFPRDEYLEPVICHLGDTELRKIKVPNENESEGYEYCTDTIEPLVLKNYFNIYNPPIAYDVEFDDEQLHWAAQGDGSNWNVNSYSDSFLKISCSSTTEPCNLVYKIGDLTNDFIQKPLCVKADITIEGDRTVNFTFGKSEIANSSEYFLFPKSGDNPADSSYYVGNLVDGQFLALKIEFIPGPNATADDYAEISNIMIYEGTVDSPAPEEFIPYWEEAVQESMFIKNKTASLTLDGTESGWSCDEYDTGIYAMSLEEDSDNPWNVASELRQTEVWDESLGDTITVEQFYSSDIWCTHFKHHAWDKTYGFEAGDCCFDSSGKFVFYTDQQTTLNEWLTWLQENPITIYYGMEVDGFTTTQIEDETLLEEIQKIKDEQAKKYLQNWFHSFKEE